MLLNFIAGGEVSAVVAIALLPAEGPDKKVEPHLWLMAGLLLVGAVFLVLSATKLQELKTHLDRTRERGLREEDERVIGERLRRSYQPSIMRRLLLGCLLSAAALSVGGILSATHHSPPTPVSHVHDSHTP